LFVFFILAVALTTCLLIPNFISNKIQLALSSLPIFAYLASYVYLMHKIIRGETYNLDTNEKIRGFGLLSSNIVGTII
jgi:hypothetical protein